MSKIFIFSNSFIAHNIIYGFDKVLNIECEEFILLSENHNNFDFETGANRKVLLLESLEMCVKLCDCIFVFEDRNIPQKSLLYIKELSQLYQKKMYLLNLFSDEYYYDLKTDINEYKFCDVPVILNIALGLTSQFYTMELLLNRIFGDNNIPFKQFFSQSMYNYMSQLYNYSIINDQLSNQLFKCKEYQVLIVTIDIGDDIYNLREHGNFIRKISPDYIMLQTDFKSIDYKTAHTAVNMFCNSPLDIIINSCYCNLHDKNFIIRCNNRLNHKNIKSIESPSLKEDLTFDIFSKIAVPNGITSY